MRTTPVTTCAALLPHPTTWIDLVDKRFGQLTALGYTGVKTRHGQKQVTCRCDCGLYVSIAPSSLRSGATTSCGCFHSAQLRARNQEQIKHGHARGRRVTPEYAAWQAMINRCHKPNDARYSLYGGRGISVCERWRSDFRAFLDDVGLRPSRVYSLHRIDNDGNYKPGNVKWATPTEQNRNQRSTKRYTVGDEELTIGEWAARSGLSHERLYTRVVKYHWTMEEAIQTPPAKTLEKDDLHGRWWQMVARCVDPNHSRYPDYGGRGITVCDRWLSFDNFAADVGLPPSSMQCTIDRTDNNRGYEPGNVRWATYTEQTRNRRNTKRYKLGGRYYTLTEWAKLADLDYETVKRRIHAGWPLDEALGTPKGFGRCPLTERRAWMPPWVNHE